MTRKDGQISLLLTAMLLLWLMINGAGNVSAQGTASPNPTSSPLIPKPIQPLKSNATLLKEQAIQEASQAAQAYPEDPLTHVLLGAAYYNIGRSDEAETHLRRCLKLNPEIVEAHEMLAKIAYERGEPELAIQLCQEAFSKGAPSSTELLNRLGKSLMDLGRTEAAIKALLQSAASNNPSAETCYLLGQAYMQDRQFEHAKQQFLQTIQRIPDHTQAYFGLMTACQRMDQTDEATSYRETFIHLESTDRTALQDRSGKEDTLSGVSMVSQTVAKTLFGAAQIHLAHGAYAKAEALFLDSARLDADNLTFRSFLESFYVERKTLPQGISAFEQLVESQPDNVLNLYYLGRLETRLGHFEKAEENYQKVLKLTPTWASGMHALAELYLIQNRQLDQARKLAQQAVDLEPTDARYYLLAVACAKNKDLTSALNAANEALAQSPEDARYIRLTQQLKAAISKGRSSNP